MESTDMGVKSGPQVGKAADKDISKDITEEKQCGLVSSNITDDRDETFVTCDMSNVSDDSIVVGESETYFNPNSPSVSGVSEDTFFSGEDTLATDTFAKVSSMNETSEAIKPIMDTLDESHTIFEVKPDMASTALSLEGSDKSAIGAGGDLSMLSYWELENVTSDHKGPAAVEVKPAEGEPEIIDLVEPSVEVHEAAPVEVKLADPEMVSMEPKPAVLKQGAVETEPASADELSSLEELETAPVEVTPADPEISTEALLEPEEAELSAPEQLPDDWIKPIDFFRKLGLVGDLVYWRDPKKSGIVFGSGLGVLLSLSFFSLISVIAYLSLLVLCGTICFRIYKNVLQAIQKTSDGHPFKDILEMDLALPQGKVREVTDIAVAHVNASTLELRRLFLVEDLVDSIKFGVLLWCLTYLGAWFNGMTLIMIGFVAMFTLPKVYENNKSQIDQNLEIVRGKLADISAKVKAAIPIGKKPAPAAEEKKDQ